MEYEDDEKYLKGYALMGDQFGPSQLEEWYKDEAQGYAGLVNDEIDYNYNYHTINKKHGFSMLEQSSISHALGIGSAYAHEFLPIIDRVKRLTVIDPGDKFEKPEIAGVPINYVKPMPSGTLEVGDDCIDLVTCFGVLHHIPNVTYVVSEMGRVLKPGGVALIREPISNMGDWRKPRAGLTKRERGIPIKIMRTALQEAGLRISRETPCMFSGLGALCARTLGVTQPFNSSTIVAVDKVVSRVMAWNARYDRRPVLAKIAPSNCFWVCKCI